MPVFTKYFMTYIATIGTDVRDFLLARIYVNPGKMTPQAAFYYL